MRKQKVSTRRSDYGCNDPRSITYCEKMRGCFILYHQSPSENSWWYIPPEDFGSLYDDEEFGGQWFLVNYKERRIFRGPSQRSSYWGMFGTYTWTESEIDGDDEVSNEAQKIDYYNH